MENKVRYFEPVRENMRKNCGEVIMPLRATKTSAGYDLFAPYDITIKPQEKVMIWTDIKASMPQGEMLMADVTSSMGGKQDLMLANTIGIIDADYYSNPSNDGNIGICLRNLKPSMRYDGVSVILMEDGNHIDVPVITPLFEENTVVIKKGQKIGQVIFVEYKPASNCNSENERKGGWGSTNK